MAKERLEAIDSLWWCVAWNHVISYAKSMAHAKKDGLLVGEAIRSRSPTGAHDKS